VLTRQLAIGLIIGGTLGGLAIGGLTGWTLNGWRLSGRVAELQGVANTQHQSIATLRGANDNCTAAVGGVKGAVQQIADQVDKNSRAARAAMARAEKAAAGHLDAARSALNRPLPPAGAECDALVREAIDYATRRKAAP
jgi:hypothetical protein